MKVKGKNFYCLNKMNSNQKKLIVKLIGINTDRHDEIEYLFRRDRAN